MGAGYVNLRGKRKRQQRKAGREEEGSSSNRPEVAAFVLALRGTPVTRCSHGMARQDKSRSHDMARASPERMYGELWR